jgi:hypothetical protein
MVILRVCRMADGSDGAAIRGFVLRWLRLPGSRRSKRPSSVTPRPRRRRVSVRGSS